MVPRKPPNPMSNALLIACPFLEVVWGIPENGSHRFYGRSHQPRAGGSGRTPSPQQRRHRITGSRPATGAELDRAFDQEEARQCPAAELARFGQLDSSLWSAS